MTSVPLEFAFRSVGGRRVCARFDGGDITSDSGLLLLKQANDKLKVVESLAGSICDVRQAGKVQHDTASLLAQRMFGIACGYEDANDHDTLRSDAALKVACGRAPKSGEDLASQPTLSRLENAVTPRDLRRMMVELARIVVGQLPADCKQIVLDIDATEDPCHGQQELNLFNKFYDSHCYLPLLLFATGDDDQRRLMGGLLRHGKAHGTHGIRVMLKGAVRLIRQRFPNVQIILRADSGFGCEKTIRCCERLGIDFVLGLPKNRRLTVLSTAVQMDACIKYNQVGRLVEYGYLKEEERPECLEFGEFEYKAGPWKHKYRVVVKAEITQAELNPRFVVTNRTKMAPDEVYEFYCARGDAENGIKEFKADLHADRTSCHRFTANQFRVLLHTGAAILMQAIRDAAAATKYAKAQIGTMRLRLLKIGARIVESVRCVWVHMSSSYPDQAAWQTIYTALRI